MALELRESQKPLGIVMKCYCGSDIFTLHSLGKIGYMVRCAECKKRYTITDGPNEDKLTRPTN